LGKELSPSNKSKESGLASNEGVANFLGGKESISMAGLAGCCVERSSLPCSELMLCSQEEPFQGGCAHIMLAIYVHNPIGKLSCFLLLIPKRRGTATVSFQDIQKQFGSESWTLSLSLSLSLSLFLCSLPLMNIFNQWNKLTCEWKKNRKKKKTVLANVFQKFHKKDIYKGY